LLQEENLRAALLLEQAAWALLRTQPPHARKFAFHMVLSGLRYNACQQVPLGMRAYRWAAQCLAYY
jgi:trafficking protein particle complex subunit 8